MSSMLDHRSISLVIRTSGMSPFLAIGERLHHRYALRGSTKPSSTARAIRVSVGISAIIPAKLVSFLVISSQSPSLT